MEIKQTEKAKPWGRLLPCPETLPTYRPQQALGLLDGPIAPQEAHKHHHSSHSNENVDAWGEEEFSEQAACLTAPDRSVWSTHTHNRQSLAA